VAVWCIGDFNAQELANTAWAFATVGKLETTTVSVMSQEVLARIRGYDITRQIGEGLPSDFAMHVTSVIWALNFAGVLEPELAEAVRDVLRIVGCEMDRSRLGSYKMPRCRERTHSGPDEPCVEFDVGDIMVIYKPPGWEVDTANVGDARWLSEYLQSLCAWPWQSIALDIFHEYGFLHRLDTPSSGLITTAKTYEAYYNLKFQLSVGTLVRDYVVLCHGYIPPERRMINARVYHKSVEGNLASTICQRGKPSKT